MKVMTLNKHLLSLATGLCVTLLAACAAPPPAVSPAPTVTPTTAPAPAPGVAQADAAKAETDTAEALESKFREAAKGYKVVERNGKTLYCKREKVIGSTIPTLQCMTESQLRLQVEQMDDLRERMRTGSKCTLGRGCSGG
jgi:hypothetical protein